LTGAREARRRTGAGRTQQEDARLLAIADLPPHAIATSMARSWDACRRRLRYLRAGASPVRPEPAGTVPTTRARR